jgi:hypothetical protein
MTENPCEVEGCENEATMCECGAAHCADHPHVTTDPEYGLGHERSKPHTTVVRLTHWDHPDKAMTVATTENDLKVTVVEAIEGMLDARHGFFTYETFDAPVDDIITATAECVRRAEEAREDERNMAIAYFWYANALRVTRPEGCVISNKPAPLTREQMAWVFRSLAYHENYKGQDIYVPLQDGTAIEMKKGEVLPV